MINIAIFASGSGSNAENIVNFFKNNSSVSISLIISNKTEAFIHKRAENLGIRSLNFTKHQFENTSIVLDSLKENQIDFIILAGFLLKVPLNLIDAYPERIVNIHPALLPKFGGKGMYGDNVHKAVVDNKETESGITIHYINENYDEGSIAFQAKCQILPSDTYQDVAEKIHQLEYFHFPRVINDIIKKL